MVYVRSVSKVELFSPVILPEVDFKDQKSSRFLVSGTYYGSEVDLDGTPPGTLRLTIIFDR